MRKRERARARERERERERAGGRERERERYKERKARFSHADAVPLDRLRGTLVNRNGMLFFCVYLDMVTLPGYLGGLSPVQCSPSQKILAKSTRSPKSILP